jgi:hypothetical protein
MEEFQKIIFILKKVFPKLLSNPEVMRGCDISQKEIDEIIENRKLSLQVLENVAGDMFFKTYYDKVGITLGEAKKISSFLYKTAKHCKEDLKKEFPYLKE